MKESLRGRGPVYVFGDAGVEMQETGAATLAEALEKARQAAPRRRWRMRSTVLRAPVVVLTVFVFVLLACSLPSLPGAPTTVAPCAWAWASRPLPELSARLREALDEAGIAVDSARAVAYGENCVDAETNEVRRFAVMQTDLHITLPVDDVADLDALGELAAAVLDVLDGFPPSETPGPQAGYVGITFVAGEEELGLWFKVPEGVEARDRGLRGAALLEALRR